MLASYYIPLARFSMASSIQLRLVSVHLAIAGPDGSSSGFKGPSVAH